MNLNLNVPLNFVIFKRFVQLSPKLDDLHRLAFTDCSI